MRYFLKHAMQWVVVPALLAWGAVTPVSAQTNPAAQSLPYSQDFSALAHSSSTYPGGWQGWRLSGGSSGSFKTSTPTDDLSLIANSSASNSTAGVHNYNGKIGLLASGGGGGTDPAVVLAINTTGLANISVDYDVMTIRNPHDGSGNTRINEVTLQYRVGTSGNFTTLTGIEYQNNTTTQTGSGVTTPQNLQSKNIVLPAVCNNNAVVQLRWVQRDVSGSGSRPSFAVDDISISASSGNTYTATSSFIPPAGVSSVTVEAWGGGGKGGQRGTPDGGAGGGGGGAYARSVLTVSSLNTYDVIVGEGSNTTAAGGNSIFKQQPSGPDLVRAVGGNSVANNATSGVAGGLASASLGNVTYDGGRGADASTSSGAQNGGGGGSSGGTGSNGNYTSSGINSTGGAVTGGGSGGNGSTTDDTPGSPGNAPGGGGGGARRNNATVSGGDGADGQIIITFTCPTYTLNATSAVTPICTAAGTSVVTLTSSAAGLPTGIYTVTYNRSLPSATGLTASMTVTTAGSGSFTVTGLTTAGGSTITITNLASGVCSSAIGSNNTATITVTATPAAPTGSAAQTFCSSNNPTVANLTATGSNIQWYDMATGGNLLIPTTALVDGTHYYASQTVSGCESTARFDVTATVNTAPTTSGDIICAGESGELTSTTICAASEGPDYAGTGNNITGIGTLAWSNPGNILSDNGSNATASVSSGGTTTVTTNYLRGTNYGFGIPANATITGIQVSINRFSSLDNATNNVQDNIVRLVKGGTIVGNNKSATGNWSTSNTTVANYGGVNDTWGETWTPADINASNFGIALSATINRTTGNTVTASVDYIQITVTYTVPIDWFTAASGGTVVQSGSPFNPIGDDDVIAAGGVYSNLINSNTPGTYTFYAECSLYPGCRTAADFVINPVPTADAGAALTAICQGGVSAPLGGAVGGAATGGTWSDGGVGGTFTPGATNLNATWTPPGSYSGTATLTLTSSGGSCGTATDSKTQVVHPLPTITTSGALAAVCFSTGSQTTTLNYSATTNSPTSYSIDWDAAANTAGLTDQSSTAFSFLAGGGTLTGIAVPANVPSGNYNGVMTVTTANNCSATQAVTLTVNALPAAVTVSGGGTFCGSTTLNASNGGDGTIYFQGTTSGGASTATPGATQTVVASGVYYFRALSAEGCWGPEGSATVTINPLPTISTGGAVSTVCFNAGAQTATLAYSATTNSPTSYSIDWNAGGPADQAGTAFAFAAGGGTVNNISISGGTPAGIHFGTMTISTAAGCTATQTVYVIVGAAPATTGVAVCPGGSGSLASSTNCSLASVNTGARDAGAGANQSGVGTVVWTSTGNVVSDNNSYATAGVGANTTTQYLRANNYGFNIPASATINGVQVTIGRFTSGTSPSLVRDNVVSLVVGGVVSGDNKAATGTDWPIAEAAASYGGAADAWGLSLTPAGINAADFGVVLSAKNTNLSGGNRTFRVDYIQVTVTFTLNGVVQWYTVSSGGSPIGTGASFNPVGVSGSGLPDTNTPGTYPFYAACSTSPECRTATNFVVYQKPTAVSCTPVADACYTNSGSVQIEASGGTPPYSVTWTPAHGMMQPASIGSSGGSVNVTGLHAGQTYTFTVTDQNNCPAQ